MYARRFERSLIRKFSLQNSLRSNIAPNLLRTVQNDGKISMVLDPLSYYFVFLIYTEGYSNHYGCVCCTVWVDIFCFHRQKV